MSEPGMKGPGDRVPQTSFKVLRNGDWETWESPRIFNGRTVVLFALPGAFTPTCSKSHLPGYRAQAVALRAAGVDEIYCLSMNDSYVMNAWAASLGVADEVTMLPDGNGDFTRAMGMLVEKSNLGFGFRSWRYAMLVLDGVIAKMFIEDWSDRGDPFKVSDALTMLNHLNSRSAAAE